MSKIKPFSLEKDQNISKVRLIYKQLCIFCGSKNVFAATNDGGSKQTCKDCNKTYKALISGSECNHSDMELYIMDVAPSTQITWKKCKDCDFLFYG